MTRRSRNLFYVDLGFRLRQARTLKGLSQEAIGERLGLSKQTIQRYETGEIHIPSDIVARCAMIVGTSVGFLYGEDDREDVPRATNRVGLMVAAEIMALPDDTIRRSVWHLVRAINRHHDPEERRTKDRAA